MDHNKFLADLDRFAWSNEVCDAVEQITGERPASKGVGMDFVAKSLREAGTGRQTKALLAIVLVEVYATTLKVWTREVLDGALNKDEAVDALVEFYLSADGRRESAADPIESAVDRLDDIPVPLGRKLDNFRLDDGWLSDDCPRLNHRPRFSNNITPPRDLPSSG